MPAFVLSDFYAYTVAYVLEHPLWLLLLAGVVVWIIAAGIAEARRKARWLVTYRKSHRLQLRKSSEGWRKLQREAHARRMAGGKDAA